jgi:hypothetical protein
MFLGLPDPLVSGMDPVPSIIVQKSKKNLGAYYFVTLLDFLSLKKDVNFASKSDKQKKWCYKFVFCWHGILNVNDENPDPDKHKNVMDPEDFFQQYGIAIRDPRSLFRVHEKHIADDESRIHDRVVKRFKMYRIPDP